MGHLNINKYSEELNGQITRTLIIQGYITRAFPLLIYSLAVISIFFSFNSIKTITLIIQLFITIPLNWLPILNPFISKIIQVASHIAETPFNNNPGGSIT
ncbi:hypothetical protein Mgra_00004252, partial [Meloidogyne graminicola]